MSHASFKEHFDRSYLRLIKELCNRASLRGSTNITHTAISYLATMATGGKRIRPFLVQHSYALAGGDRDISSILHAIELLHFFALIHDDIMDNASIRHGVPTAHAYLADAYHNEKKAQSQAILLGDMVLSWSYEQLHTGVVAFPEKVRIRVIADFTALVEEMIVGQMMDVDMARGAPASFEDVLRKNTLKSGNYTFVWPMLIGADLAQAPDKRRSFIRMLGEELGTIFQMQDDLLDISKETGKSYCSDIEEGQQTVLSACMYHNVSDHDRAQFARYHGRKLEEHEKKELVALLDHAGAVSFVQSLIDDALTNAESLVTTYALEEIGAWQDIIDLLKHRKK